MAAVVAKLGGLVKATQQSAIPKLVTFVKYAKVELRPPMTPGEIGATLKGFRNLLTSAKSGKWKQLTVREATINGIVTAEVLCWFFVGECIGKGSIVGYQIPGAFDFDAHI